MIPQAPNLDGYLAAQRRLRQQMGIDVTLRIPLTPTWDPAEPIDPETGRPYDPFATPTSSGSGFEERTVRALIIEFLGRGREDETAVGPAGRMSTKTKILSLDLADLPIAHTATEAIVNGEPFRISELRPERSRLLVFMERR